MTSWTDLVAQFGEMSSAGSAAEEWIHVEQTAALREIGARRGTPGTPRNVLLYGSAFLQKSHLPTENLSITHEDLNGLISTVREMDGDRGLTLVLHTPGGITNAAESVIDYLRSVFSYLEVIVPAMAMSAGTTIALSADRVLMGPQSQLGPIDPQFVADGRQMSARAITDMFERARHEVLGTPAAGIAGDLRAAHLWAPILQSYGPALLQEAQNALDYCGTKLTDRLARHMCGDRPDPQATARHISAAFSDDGHRNHGRRINADEAISHGVSVEMLEDDPVLADDVLTSYYLMTILFEQSHATKILSSDRGDAWVKNWLGAAA